MPERDIPTEEILTFAQGDKPKHLCRVKHCRTRRMGDRTICSKHNMELWRARNPIKAAYHHIRDRARSKRIAFTLTYEEFVGICEATGYAEGKGRHAHELHLDRIDARKGYSLDNVRVITCSENSRKGCYEKRIQLRDGRWVMLHEIGIGVPAPNTPEDDDWVDPNSLGDIDWDSEEYGSDADDSAFYGNPTGTNSLPPDHPDWTPF